MILVIRFRVSRSLWLWLFFEVCINIWGVSRVWEIAICKSTCQSVFCVFLFFFIFGMCFSFRGQSALFMHYWALFTHCWALFTHQWVPCTVPGTHKPHFSTIFSLKMGRTILFTHLKIILLQCFQFSAK